MSGSREVGMLESVQIYDKNSKYGLDVFKNHKKVMEFQLYNWKTQKVMKFPKMIKKVIQKCMELDCLFRKILLSFPQSSARHVPMTLAALCRHS